jgi:hypothetical protein
MRNGAIVTGVLGLGTALVFALAAVTATLFPNGTVVSNGMNGMMFDRGFGGGGVAVPVPAPAINVGPDVTIQGGGVVNWGGSGTLPGDIVVTDPTFTAEPVPAP